MDALPGLVQCVASPAPLARKQLTAHAVALSNTVFIDRGNRTSAFAAFDGAVKQMHSKRQSVYIFPEGTRSYYDRPDMLPFKKGAFHLAVQAQVPVVPIVVANYAYVLNIRRRVFWPGRIPIRVLPPIETKGLTATDVDALCARTRDVMMKALVELSDQGKDANGTVEAKASGVDVNGKGVLKQN